MITRDDAHRLVNEYLATRKSSRVDDPRVVWEDQTEEYQNCWVCFWVSKKYLETRDRQYRLGGNYPIIVDKTDGSLYLTGFRPVAEYVSLFNSDKSQLAKLTPG